MPRFRVSIPVTGSLTFEVHAKSRGAAVEAAWDTYNESGGADADLQWEACECVCEGNVCRAELNEIEVSEVK